MPFSFIVRKNLSYFIIQELRCSLISVLLFYYCCTIPIIIDLLISTISINGGNAMTIKESDYYVRVIAFLNVGDDPKTLWTLLKDGRALLKQLMRVEK